MIIFLRKYKQHTFNKFKLVVRYVDLTGFQNCEVLIALKIASGLFLKINLSCTSKKYSNNKGFVAKCPIWASWFKNTTNLSV